MPSFEDRLKKHFGDSLPEGEKLYTKENLNAIEQLKDLYSEDLNFILHQICFTKIYLLVKHVVMINM